MISSPVSWFSCSEAVKLAFYLHIVSQQCNCLFGKTDGLHAISPLEMDFGQGVKESTIVRFHLYGTFCVQQGVIGSF
jgi:hypothetical protein